MHITFDEQNRFFHLSTSEMSYAFGIAAADWHTRPFTLPAGHGDCHQPDECVWLEGVGRAAAILAYMLVRLDRKISG